jgi:hypothetical protein
MKNYINFSVSQSNISPVSFISEFYRISETEYHEKIKKILIQEYINKKLYIFPKYNLERNSNIEYIKNIRKIFLTEYKKQSKKYF